MHETPPLLQGPNSVQHTCGVSADGVPPCSEDAAILNDEALIDIAPTRAGGMIRVKFVHTGRSVPIPVVDPWGE